MLEEKLFEHREGLLQLLQRRLLDSYIARNRLDSHGNLALACRAELLRGRLQVGCDPFLFEALLRCAGPGGSGADGGFLHRFHGGDNFLGAVTRPLTRRTRALFLRASYLSKAASIP